MSTGVSAHAEGLPFEVKNYDCDKNIQLQVEYQGGSDQEYAYKVTVSGGSGSIDGSYGLLGDGVLFVKESDGTRLKLGELYGGQASGTVAVWDGRITPLTIRCKISASP